MRRFYLVTRDLHLYVGLFLSPFILVFALSVFSLVHGFASRPAPNPSDSAQVVTGLTIPPDLAKLQGRARVDALRPVLDKLDVRGEIDFVRHVPEEHKVIVPVRLPARDAIVTLDYEKRTAMVVSTRHSVGQALVYLHKMPGPHNVDVRGNSWLVRAWAFLADVTVYLLLFLTLSGVYMWAVLKAERRIGLVLIFAGALSFFGLVYAIAA
jgi:hypothetical protein